MKVSEVSVGTTNALTVVPVVEDFDPAPASNAEVTLLRSGDQALLVYGDVIREVAGRGPSDAVELSELAAGGAPALVFVAQATPSSMVLQVRRFPHEFKVPEQIQIGLDDKVMDDVRRSFRVGGTALDVSAWMRDRLVLPAAPRAEPEFRRIVISGDPLGRLDAFRIFGVKAAADVRRVEGKLRIERVVRGGRNNHQRLALLTAPLSIVDATAAAELHGAARVELSEVVGGDQSYLRVWQDYQRLERESVMRRAKSFGALRYESCERRRDGGWSFKLAPTDDLEARLGTLREASRVELEAGEQAPSFEDESGDPPSRKKTEALSATVSSLDITNRRLDLAGPEEDGEQPKPPSTGYLFVSTHGDEVRLRRRRTAEEALRTGTCHIPQLGLLMEGRPVLASRRTRVSVNGPKLKTEIRDVFKGARPTQRQLDAIERAINTPDVCLIQGPPGTGKTKVITAIQRCLAVLTDEGVEVSHRVLATAAQHDAVENLVQRTKVFGLPADKVGKRRRGADSAYDVAQAFADDRIEALRAKVKVPLEAERLAAARGLVLSCVRTCALTSEQARRIRRLVEVVDDLLPPALRDAALARSAELERPRQPGDVEDQEILLKAARGIRVEEAPFTDDGPIKARVALRRLQDVLTDSERAFLERCADSEPEPAPSWLSDGRALRDAIIDRLTPAEVRPEVGLDEETEALLLDLLDALDRRVAKSRVGKDGAIAAYLHDLEHDPEGVREAIRHYTVVLASTLQQSAGREMRRVRRIDVGQVEFESVIVDEAGRANPLDLFIPLSMAKRRVVLVGDHRQLPHLLEPDVERQLEEGREQGSVEEETLRNVQASLFERLWWVLRRLEDSDQIDRTVTLDVQYRMHPVLGAFVSREFYELHGDGEISSPDRSPDAMKAAFDHDLPGYVLGDGKPCVAAWLDVPNNGGSSREIRRASKRRPIEARVIAKEVRRLIDHDSRLTFGVIAFYSAQVDEIGRAMIKEGLATATAGGRGWKIAEQWQTTLDHDGDQVEQLRVGTVDAFQGKEFDVVILSITRSNDLSGTTDEQQRRKYGHLMLENRMCVAMSRQKRLLITAGDLAFVREEEAREPLRSLNAFAELTEGDHGIRR